MCRHRGLPGSVSAGSWSGFYDVGILGMLTWLLTARLNIYHREYVV